MLTPLLGVAPIYGVSFAGYEIGVRFTKNLSSNFSKENPVQIGVIPGAFSAFPTTLLTVPGERLKITLQAGKEKSLAVLIKKIWYNEGLLGFYRGSSWTLLRDVPGYSAYFTAYAFTKTYLQRETDWSRSWTIPFLSGAAAGAAMWIPIMPFDVIKTRVQLSPVHAKSSDLIKQLIKENGLTGLYKGLGPALIRAIPANAVGIWAAELTMNWLSRNRNNRHQ